MGGIKVCNGTPMMADPGWLRGLIQIQIVELAIPVKLMEARKSIVLTYTRY